jgi:hypothetical protein
MEYQETICAAIRTFGKENQTFVAIEELSELQKELCKLLRGNCDNFEHIAEEIADVEIVLWELVEMMKLGDMVDMYRAFKLQRLKSRIAIESEKRGAGNGIP